jgi:hypothetical protein
MNVAVAVCMLPSPPFASAVMVALPIPKALTIPAVAPSVPAVLVLTGKTLGTEEIQFNVGEFVRSLTVGAVENVPIARNCPVSCKLPTVIELGIMVSESRFPPAGPEPPPEPVTMRVALELTEPLNAIALAVIVVVPALTAVTMPEALTVATEATLEAQVTVLVTFCVERWFALPYVPTAVNCAV